MIKVLHLLWRFDGGGIEEFCLNLLRHMDKSNYHFDFVVCGNKTSGEEDKILENSKIYHLHNIDGRIGKHIYLKELRKILMKYSYDVIHSHLAFMNISTLKVAKECGVKHRISHVHVAGYCDEKRPIIQIKQVLLNHYATLCIACSQETANFYYGYNSSKLDVIYSGIDITRFKQANSKKDKQFIVVSRMVAEKNPYFILDVIRGLSRQFQDYQFVWCGDGPEYASLREKANQYKVHISFLGNVNNVEKYLSTSSFMLMPSIKEGFGMAAVEAQLSNVYVFASDRVPRDTDLGLIAYYPLDNVDEWVFRISEFIKSHGFATHVLLSERKIDQYNIDRIANKFMRYYKDGRNY